MSEEILPQVPDVDLEKTKKQLEISKLEIECEQLNLARCELKKRWFQKPQWIAALSPIFVGFLTLIVVLSSGILQNQATLNKIQEEKYLQRNVTIDSTIKQKELMLFSLKSNYDSLGLVKLHFGN